MSLRPYIPVDVDNLPEKFEFDFGEVTYTIKVDYNSVGNFFTVDLFDANMTPIILGEKLVLNKSLWLGLNDENLPYETIVPMDEAGKETELTKENFGKTVFLFLDVLSPAQEDQDNGVLNNG